MSCETECKTLTNVCDRIDKIENKLDHLSDKVIAVERDKAVSDQRMEMVFSILTEIKDTIKEMNDSLGQRLVSLERTPGERWEKLTTTILVALATALVGYFIGRV